jgi:hypothetical protein
MHVPQPHDRHVASDEKDRKKEREEVGGIEAQVKQVDDAEL